MKRYIYSAGAVLLLGGCLPAMADTYYVPQYPVHWYVDGGYSMTTGQTSNYLDNGWNIGGGVQWRPAPGPFSRRTMKSELSLASSSAPRAQCPRRAKSSGVDDDGRPLPRGCSGVKLWGPASWDDRPFFRLAPIALYTSFADVWQVVQHLRAIIDGREHEAFAAERDLVA